MFIDEKEHLEECVGLDVSELNVSRVRSYHNNFNEENDLMECEFGCGKKVCFTSDYFTHFVSIRFHLGI